MPHIGTLESHRQTSADLRIGSAAQMMRECAALTPVGKGDFGGSEQLIMRWFFRGNQSARPAKSVCKISSSFASLLRLLLFVVLFHIYNAFGHLGQLMVSVLLLFERFFQQLNRVMLFQQLRPGFQ